MSLYHEAANVLNTAKENGGSIKSIVFSRKPWKSDPKALFALATDTAKWSDVLSEVIEKSSILKMEKQLAPEIALLLTHDLLLAKRGVSLPSKHGFNIAITRHKARLAAEFTKVRLQRGFPTLDGLKSHVNSNAHHKLDDISPANYNHPRWIRINLLRTSMEEELISTFATYKRSRKLSDITSGQSEGGLVFVDEHIPNLIAIRWDGDITASTAYTEGKLILQEKASCFPACLLDPSVVRGDIIDACAAPGNKTTHLAALVASANTIGSLDTRKCNIIACERDKSRSETLAKMTKIAGATDIVRIKQKQDFLQLDPLSKEFADVRAILLDPSCSGSGIVGRDEVTLNIRLPHVDEREHTENKSRKRKRNGSKASTPSEAARTSDVEVEEVPTEFENGDSKLEARLSALSAFQLRLLEHAMAFSNAKRIIYSTCSLHKAENEQVVVNGLLSDVALNRKWRILRREEQVDGLRKWHKRGNMEGVLGVQAGNRGAETPFSIEEIADACIRCDKAGESGTMGFFVAGFVRDSSLSDMKTNGSSISGKAASSKSEDGSTESDGSEEDWNGFSDDE